MTAPLSSSADPAAALRSAALVEARRWLGTPYRHQASRRGAGADCLGLIRGVHRALYGREPERPPGYTPDWSEFSGDERLLAAAGRHLRACAPEAAAPGCVLAFRMRAAAPVKHLGLLSAPDAMIHAYSGRGVVESALGAGWRRRLVAVFDWPLPPEPPISS